MKTVLTCAMIALVTVSAWAQEEADLTAMMEMFEGMAQTQEETAPAATVNPRALRNELPEGFSGFERIEAGSTKQGAFGMTTAVATGVYEQDNQTVRIEITDMSAMGGFGAIAMMGMAQTEVDKETRHGFERTTTYQGFKALESFDRSSQNGEIQIFLGGRIMITVSGSGLTDFETLSAAVKAMDLKKISELQPEPSE